MLCVHAAAVCELRRRQARQRKRCAIRGHFYAVACRSSATLSAQHDRRTALAHTVCGVRGEDYRDTPRPTPCCVLTSTSVLSSHFHPPSRLPFPCPELPEIQSADISRPTLPLQPSSMRNDMDGESCADAALHPIDRASANLLTKGGEHELHGETHRGRGASD